uniref:Enkurin domain-containing protein n=1 Tax=Spongospora subterranea TaxID=70186 RepID=A0A0H5RA87_9EUKA|eukprot:CRZ11065.1 hypothetical protein [Spongospora subterranea]
MEARRNADKNMSGDAVAFAINPKHPFKDFQYRGSSKGTGIKKDHARENRELIKQLQRKAKEKAEEEEARKSLPVFRMKRFAEAGSKLGTMLKEGTVPKEGVEKKRDFLRKGSGSLRRSHSSEGEAGPHNSNICQMGSLKIGEGPPAGEKPKNFIKHNLKTVVNAHPPKVNHVEPTPITQEMWFGRVPLYIHKRKVELAQKQEEKRLDKEKEKLPPGMTLMSEEERQRTVELLLQNQQKLMGQLAKMPLTIETPSLVEKHNQINAKIEEVESALKLFSRKKVYITA